MARYKDYIKGDKLVSLRMYGWIDENGLSFKYVGLREDYKDSDNEMIPIDFKDRDEGEKYFKGLGYKEW